METELISVIVPVYNVERYLRRCVDSILHQTYRNLEVLLVDDVISTGESLSALEDLVHEIGGNVVGKAAVLAEGDAKDRTDIIYLEPLPLFFK